VLWARGGAQEQAHKNPTEDGDVEASRVKALKAIVPGFRDSRDVGKAG
jgi:hypothetical protein